MLQEDNNATTKEQEQSGNTVEENTISQNTENEVTVPVKFNKVTQNLSIQEAANLAQKGLKFEHISEDYDRLRRLAAKKDVSVSQLLDNIEKAENQTQRQSLLEKCGGDEELVNHIVSLENKNEGDNGFQEIKSFFPDIENPEMLPQSVIDASKLRGTKLLDEYLRYQLKEKRSRAENQKSQKAAENAAVGSQHQSGAALDPVNSEFLRGIWSR